MLISLFSRLLRSPSFLGRCTAQSHLKQETPLPFLSKTAQISLLSFKKSPVEIAVPPSLRNILALPAVVQGREFAVSVPNISECGLCGPLTRSLLLPLFNWAESKERCRVSTAEKIGAMCYGTEVVDCGFLKQKWTMTFVLLLHQSFFPHIWNICLTWGSSFSHQEKDWGKISHCLGSRTYKSRFRMSDSQNIYVVIHLPFSSHILMEPLFSSNAFCLRFWRHH